MDKIFLFEGKSGWAYPEIFYLASGPEINNVDEKEIPKFYDLSLDRCSVLDWLHTCSGWKTFAKMKKIIILTGVLTAFLLMAFVGKKLHTDTYKVDTKLSVVEWYAEKLNGKHNGTIMFSSGEIQHDHGKLTGTFEIDMNTIENKDMEQGEYKTKLETHLKSEDFFGVATFPKSKFIITSVNPVTEAKQAGFTHTVKGNLTIKDKTNEISFDAIIKMEGSKIVCTGTVIVDRSKFDVKYGSKTFFEDIGDKMIYDEFTLKFNIVAVK